MLQTIEVEGKKINFASNGRTLRLYRSCFNKDMLQTLIRLQKHISNELEMIENFDFSIIDEVAWVCAYTADNTIPKIDDWLSQFESPLSLLNHTNEIISLVFDSMKTSVESKKNIITK